MSQVATYSVVTFKVKDSFFYKYVCLYSLFHIFTFCSYSPLTVCASVHFYTLDNYDAEGYNPESPGLTVAGRNPYRQFIPRVQTQRSNLIGLTSSEGQGSRGNNLIYRVFVLFF